MDKIVLELLKDETKFENAAKTLFFESDLNGDHIVDYNEFRHQIFRISDDLNLSKPSDDEIKKIISIVDSNKNKKIEYKEFKVFLKNLFSEISHS